MMMTTMPPICALLNLCLLLLASSSLTAGASSFPLHECVPLGRQQPSSSSHANIINNNADNSSIAELLLPVVVISSPEVQDMVGHLVQSMLLAETFVSVPFPSNDSIDEMLSGFASRMCGVVNKGTFDQQRPVVDVVAVRPCLLIVQGPPISSDHSNQQQQPITYHLALERKMRALTAIVVESHVKGFTEISSNNNNKDNRGGSGDTRLHPGTRQFLLDRLLILDADSQVFPGWFRNLIVPRLGLTVSAATTKNRAKKDGKTTDNNNINNIRKKPLFPRREVKMFFQREASNKYGRHDKINTGTMLVHTDSKIAVSVFLKANATVERKKGGDQTAMQRVLRRYLIDDEQDKAKVVDPQQQQESSSRSSRRKKATLVLADALMASEALSEGLRRRQCEGRGRQHDDDDTVTMNERSVVVNDLLDEAHTFDYAVFPKYEVNAGQVDAQRKALFIHHAHMSGSFKRKNLKEVFLWKYQQQHHHHHPMKESVQRLSESFLRDTSKKSRRRAGGGGGPLSFQSMCPSESSRRHDALPVTFETCRVLTKFLIDGGSEKRQEEPGRTTRHGGEEEKQETSLVAVSVSLPSHSTMSLASLNSQGGTHSSDKNKEFLLPKELVNEDGFSSTYALQVIVALVVALLALRRLHVCFSK